MRTEPPGWGFPGAVQSGSRRVAVAFHVATTRSPGRRCSRSTAGSVSSAVSGCGAARPTRTRLPTAVTETTSTSRWLRAEPGSTVPRRGQRDVPRVDGDGDRAALGVRRGHLSPAVERHAREPARARRGRAGQHDGAGEVGHEGRRRLGGQLARGADLDDPPGVHHPDAVAEQRGLLEVVRDEQRGHARLVQHRRQLATGRRARAGVERRQRLVEQQRGGLDGERAGERHALALAARQRARPRLGAVGEPEALEQRQRPLAPVPPRQAVADVLPRAQVREQRVVLEHEAAAPLLGRQVDAARPVEPDALAARHPPRPRRSRPAAIRSTLLLPAPDGPGEREALAGGDLELRRRARRRRAGSQPRREASPSASIQPQT